MNRKKTVLRYFTIADWKKEEEFLAKMHRDGWKFTSLNFIGIYHFTECEPDNVVYQLDFNPDGMAHKDEYVKMFSDCGWEYLQDYVGYSYFRKPVSQMNGGDEEIFCDDESRIEMMKRVFKGRLIPLLILYVYFIFAFFLTLSTSNPLSPVLSALYIFVLLTYSAMFLSFGLKFYSYLKSVKK